MATGVRHRGILATWQTSSRLTSFLIENLPDEVWRAKIPEGGLGYWSALKGGTRIMRWRASHALFRAHACRARASARDSS